MQEKIQKIENRVKELFDEADLRYCGEQYFFKYHITVVKGLALELAKNRPVDNEILTLACILHDIGYIYDPTNHTNPDYARKIMEEFNVEAGVKDKVCSCIAIHEKSEPDACAKNLGISAEAGILQLADKLSHTNPNFLRMMKKNKKQDFEGWMLIKLKKLEMCLKENIDLL